MSHSLNKQPPLNKQPRASYTRFAVTAAALAMVALSSSARAWPAEATRELAVREGPGQHYPHIEVIPAGTVVDIRHCNVERTWCKVDVDGTVGYLRSAYLERLGDVYLGPRVEFYTTYRPRRVYGPPPRPHVRPYPPHHHAPPPPYLPPPPFPPQRW